MTNQAHYPLLLAALNPEVIPLPSKILVLVGRSAELHPLVLQSLFLRARHGEQLAIVVGDNRLNVYALARLARAHGDSPSHLLSQIQFARSFTCHQLHDSILNFSLDCSALYVLGLLDPFYDEDIPVSTVARLLNGILARLRGIASQGLSILVTISPPPPATPRRELVARVLRAADVYWQPTPEVVEFVTTQSAMG